MTKQKRKKRPRKIPTTEKLAKALEEANDPKLAEIIEKARQGYYDDYKTTIAFPIIQLVYDLEKAGHPELAQRVRKGEWEAQDWEAKEWFEREGKPLLEESIKEALKDERPEDNNETDR